MSSRQALAGGPRKRNRLPMKQSPGVSLQRLVSDRLATLDLSARAASVRGGLSHTTVAAIANGTHRGRPADATLDGLAVALDLPVSKVYAAAGVEPADPEWRLPARFRALRPEARLAVENVADTLLRMQRRWEAEATEGPG